ncbi:hypothetical protein [Streptomyces sp. NPDC002537]
MIATGTLAEKIRRCMPEDPRKKDREMEIKEEIGNRPAALVQRREFALAL